MAGRRPYNLECRRGLYWVRRRVPADLRRLLGRRELRWSVHAKDHRQAGRDALGSVVAFQSMCDRLRRVRHDSESIAPGEAIGRFIAEWAPTSRAEAVALYRRRVAVSLGVV